MEGRQRKLPQHSVLMRNLIEHDRARRHLRDAGAYSDVSPSWGSIHSSDINFISEHVASEVPDISPTEIENMLKNARAAVNRRS